MRLCPTTRSSDILPWIPPRAVCHVEVASLAGAKAHGVYIDSFIPPDRLEAAYMHDNIARVRGAAALRDQGRSEDRESRRFQFHSDRG